MGAICGTKARIRKSPLFQRNWRLCCLWCTWTNQFITSENRKIVLRGQSVGEGLGGLLVGLLVERDDEDARGGVVKAVEGAETELGNGKKKTGLDFCFVVGRTLKRSFSQVVVLN